MPCSKQMEKFFARAFCGSSISLIPIIKNKFAFELRESVLKSSTVRLRKSMRINSIRIDLRSAITAALTRLNTKLFLIIGITLFLSPIHGLPHKTRVAKGDVEIESSSGQMTIRASDQSIIHFSCFDIDLGEKVEFIQPHSKASVLGRVTSMNPTNISGILEANGRVFLINPYGICIGSEGIIHTASFLASTLDISDQDFLENKIRFSFDEHPEGSNGKIDHRGSLVAEEFVALIAPEIENQGRIIAKTDQALLKARGKFVLDFSGDRIVQFAVDEQIKKTVQALSLDAAGDSLCLSAKTAHEAIKSVVNQGDVEIATGIDLSEGKIRLVKKSEIAAPFVCVEAGQVELEGIVDASNETSNQKGGLIHILGNRIDLEDANLKANGQNGGGTILIGGDQQGKGPLPRAKYTNVHASAVIEANGGNRGNGGDIVIWADDFATMEGSIYARGGKESGKGGSIEISRQFRIEKNLKIDVGSVEPNGFGSVLLDPTDIAISAAASSGGAFSGCIAGTNTFTAAGASNTINATALGALLDAPCNVTISTASGGASTGIITVTSPVSWTSASTLTLTANSNISISSSISSTNNGGVNFNAMNFTANGTPSGSYSGILLNAALTSIFGNITLNGTSSGNGASGQIGVNFSSNGQVVTTGSGVQSGNIVIQGTGGLGTSFGSNGIGFSSTTNTKIQTTDGNITLTGTGRGASGSFANIGIDFVNAVVLSSTGTITFTGTGGVITAGGASAGCAQLFNASAGVTVGNITSTTGSILFTNCTGGTGTGAGGACSYGVEAYSGIVAAPTITGTNLRGGTSTIGGTNYGLIVTNGAVFGLSTVTTNLSITASSQGSGSSEVGIFVSGGSINIGSGTLTLNGTGSPSGTGSANYGIQTSSSGVISATTGSISLTGTAGAGTSFDLLLGRNITTSGGAITVNSRTRLGASISLDTTNSGSVPAGANINFSGTSATINATTAATQGLTLLGGTAGTVTLGGAVGATTPLGAISVTGQQILAQANISTRNGAITFNSPVVLLNSPSITTASGGTGANISFQSTLNATTAGLETLTLNAGTVGAVTLTGAVGALTPLGGLGITSAKTTVNAINIGSTITSNTFTISTASPVTLTGNSTIDTSSGNNSISFPSTINAAAAGVQSLTLNSGAGTTTFSANVGATAALSSLTVSSPLAIGSAVGVTTTLNQQYSSTINGANTLTLSSTSGGTISLLGAVGGTTPLTSLTATTTGAGTIIQSSTVRTTGAISYTSPTQITLNGASLTTTLGGLVSFTGPAILGTNVAIDTSGGNGNISIGGTLNALAAGSQSLTITAGSGTATFSNHVGASANLNLFTISSAALLSTSGNISAKQIDIHSPIQLTGSITFTATGP